MALSSKLNKFQDRIFTLFIIITYISIIVSFFGFSETAPKYLTMIDYYVKIYICLFLIWRFNPLRKITTFTDLDRKIAFSAGLFILTTTSLNQYLISLKDKIGILISKKK